MPPGLRLATCLPKPKTKWTNYSCGLDENTTASLLLRWLFWSFLPAWRKRLWPYCLLLLLLLGGQAANASLSAPLHLLPLFRIIRSTYKSQCELECDHKYTLNGTTDPPPCPLEELTSRPPRLRSLPTCMHIPLKLFFNDTCNINQWKQIWRTDRHVCRYVCEMNNIFKRFDCQHPYSVRWTCNDCKAAYLEWICALEHKLVLKPCRSLCSDVEERCPHFNPPQREQYAGEPLFYCIDPAIPDDLPIMGEVRYGPPDNCLSSCQLNASRSDCSAPTSRAAITNTPFSIVLMLLMLVAVT